GCRRKLSSRARCEAVRHPVSTFFASCGLLVDEAKGERSSSAMLGGIVGRTLLPARPDHTAPCAGEDADRVGVLVPTIACALVDAARPRIGVTRGVRERVERVAQVHVARPAERDSAVLAGLARHGCSTALGGEVVSRHEATAIITDLCEQLRGADPSAAKQL